MKLLPYVCLFSMVGCSNSVTVTLPGIDASGTPGNRSVAIRWTGYTGAQGWDAQAAIAPATATPTGNYELPGSATSASLTNLKNQVPYNISVFRYDETGNISSATLQATPTGPADFDITAALPGIEQVTLTWGDSLAADAEYTVKYGEATGNYPTVFSTTATSPTVVTGLDSNVTYFFQVTATNPNGTQDANIEIAVAPLLGPPGAFSFTSFTSGNGAVTVSWTASHGAATYTLAYGPQGGPYSHVVSTSATSPATVSNLAPNTTQYFTVTAVNSAGNTHATSELAAAVGGPHTVAGNVSGMDGSGLVVRNNGGDDITVNTNGAFTFATAIYDANYVVTVNTNPTSPQATCSVSHGTGHVSTADINDVAITCITDPTYQIGGTVRGVLGATLVLRNNGGDDFTVSANGNFAFATALNAGADYNVIVATPDSPNDVCDVALGSGTVANANISSVSVSCAPKINVFVTNGSDNTVAQYASNGFAELTALSPSIASNGNNPFFIAVTPNGQNAYAVNYLDGTIAQYAVGTNGMLLALAPNIVTAGKNSYDIVIHPAGTFAYLPNLGNFTTSQFSIAADGHLAPLTPAAISTGGTTSLVVAPNGQYAYITNNGHDLIQQYSIGSDGGLSSLNPTDLSTDSGPRAGAVDRQSKYFYAACQSGNVMQYNIGNDGTLSPMTQPSMTVTQTPSQIVVEPTNKYVYVTDYQNTVIYEFAIGANGQLSPLTPAAITVDYGAQYLTFDPTGRYALVPHSATNIITVYRIDDTGQLVLLNNVTSAGNQPARVAIGIK